MYDISLDEISKRVTDAVLAQPYINRDKLHNQTYSKSLAEKHR